MERTDESQVCFVPKGAGVLLCNAVDRNNDGQLWKTKSGKWIPIALENAPALASASSVKS
jgi:hypothetical protein